VYESVLYTKGLNVSTVIQLPVTLFRVYMQLLAFLIMNLHCC